MSGPLLQSYMSSFEFEYVGITSDLILKSFKVQRDVGLFGSSWKDCELVISFQKQIIVLQQGVLVGRLDLQEVSVS